MGAAHARFVRQVIDEADIPHRLERFPALSQAFPDDILGAYSERPPYYCHFMEWRLARLPDPYLVRLEQLFSLGEALEGWNREHKSLVRSPDFSEFWSLLWQLQVAEYLLERGYELEWMSKGPDLRAAKDGDVRYVECTVPRKHFGVALFLEELLTTVHPRFRVDHQMFLPRFIPKDAELDRFLDQLFEPLLEPGRIDSLVEQASELYPVVLPLPPGATNLSVYIDGVDADSYDPSALPNVHGDIDTYRDLILKEVVSNKGGANRLMSFPPNALAVNFLLGHDQQAAASLGESAPPDLGDNLDEMLWGSIGIRSAIADGDLLSARGWLP